MSYIGNKPANKAVVASDLDPAVITGQTALSSEPADSSNRIGCNFSFSTNDGNDASDGVISNHYQYLDSPSSTSEVTYKIQAATYNNQTLTFNRTPNNADNAATVHSTSVITAMEVLA
jgi:hypothetical protein